MMDIVPTFLGAHAIPGEFKDDPGAYIDLICERILPYIAQRKLAAFCDAVCDRNHFSIEQCTKLFKTAKSLGIRVKIHADQIAQIGASKLAKTAEAISADHLEQIDDSGISALKEAGTIATVLPGVSFFTHGSYAPARKMIDAGVPLAIASNFNPVSCMSYSLPLMMTIACTQMSLTPEEAIAATTINGAAALGLSDRLGSIEVGKQADIILFDVPNYEYLIHHFGTNFAAKIIKRGTYLIF
jgi:imidazolonepropionase